MPGQTEHKGLALTLKDDAPAGTVQAVFSTFDVLDKQHDITRPEAFAALDGAEVPLVWSHEWQTLPLGKGRIRVQPDRAIFDGAFHLQTPASRDAYETVKAMGTLQEYSYGFDIAEAEMGEAEDGTPARIITKISRVYEVSPVLVGAGEDTRTLAIKALTQSTGAKVGRRQLQAVIDVLTALCEAAPEAEASDPPTEAEAVPAAVTVAGLRETGADLASVGERLVADLHAYAAWVQATPDADLRAAKDWVSSASRRLADTRRTLDDRLRRAEEAGAYSPAELEAQFRALDARLGLVLGGGTGCRR